MQEGEKQMNLEEGITSRGGFKGESTHEPSTNPVYTKREGGKKK